MKASNHRFTLLWTVSLTASVLAATVMAGEKPEYTAAEARQHIGEKATVVGKVECISAGRTFHALELDGCSPNSPFWIIVNDNASGPDLNVQDLKGVTVAVTGQLEKRDVYSHPWMVVKSTTQIQARTALKADHISRAHEKESKGDLDGAMAEFGRAIEEQPDRRAEAYEFRGRIKERKGDWNAALADYDALVALDPKKADPYYIRATAKKQHGDFEGAMADFTRAAELRLSGISFVEIGNLRKANGDSTGAAAEYDKAIAMLDGQIAGVQKPSDRLDLLYYHRGYAKELKGDVDGAVADYSQAIAIKPSYEACAYSRRGDIKKARGDLSGAIVDYQLAVKYAQLPEDNDKLTKARAEARTRAKTVATQPNIQATQNEQSFNKSEVTPESIAEAFVQAYSGMDVDALAGLYADRVDHTNSGVISNAAVRAQAKEYFARWPVRHWSLVGPVNAVSLGTSRKKVIFSASYDASDPLTNKHALGIAKETLILATDPSGAMKIVSQKEQTSKRSSGQSDESGKKTSKDANFEATQTEYGQQSGFACKLVARGKGMQVLSGYAQRHLENGGETLLGHVNTPASTSFGSPCAGVPWMAELGLDGKLLWAARVQDQREASSSWDGLTTDGDHLWAAAVRGNRLVQLARFKAGTLEREASVQTDFPVTESAGVRTGPGFEFHSQKEGDLQVSVGRTLPDSVKLVVFSRDLRPILDKTYSIPQRLAGRESEPLWGMNLIRLPDRTGYYMVVEPHLARGGKHGPRIGIIRLDNSGAVKWANTYPTGYSESGITPRVTKDGAILVSVATYSQPEPARSLLIKISPNGTVNWATTVEDIDISFGDFQFPCQSEPAPYRFTEPSLLALGIQRDDPQEGWWMIKTYSVLFRLNYETGKIEKQIHFGANTPGSCSFLEHDANSFYVGFANQQWLDKPTGHGSRPNRVKYHAAALRFDYDFNLLAACKIRDAGPILIFFHLFAADRGVISYPDAAKGTLMVETTNANFESSTGCQWLEKENFTFTNSTFQQHPAHVDSSPLTVTVSDANSKISEADLALAPLDLNAVPCQAERK